MFIFLSVIKSVNLNDAVSWIEAASGEFARINGVAGAHSGQLDRRRRLVRLSALAVTPAALRQVAALPWVSSVSMTAGATSLRRVVESEEPGDGAALIASAWIQDLDSDLLEGALESVDAQATREALMCIARWGDTEDVSIVAQLAEEMAERIRDLMSEVASW